MLDVFYTIIIFPLVQIIELCYLFVYRVSHNPGVALFGVSIAVSTLTLPLYFRAEKWQEAERDIQRRLAPKIAKIKAVFSGDEQYMMLSTYYRQNHYHPIYAMRNTFSLLIQIPFFIAAYSYLSHLRVLQGSSFLFIRDLGAPDGLFSTGSGTVTINILPIAMTAINCVSGAIYTRGFSARDKVQIYGMALIFLALLYNSPAGLVLYWTLNNIFSLLKNILVKTKHTRQWIYGVIFVSIVFFDIYVLFFHPGYLPKRLIVCGIFSSLFFIPLLIKIPVFISHKFGGRIVTQDTSYNHRYFALSLLILLALTGLIIPGSLIASSVEEFSFIGAHTSPFPFIFHSLLQAGGIFLFWPICIYLLFPHRTRQVLSLFMTIVAFCAVFNVFLANENFGFLTNALIFSEPKSFAAGSMKAYLINLAILTAATATILYLIFKGKKMLLFSFQIITLISFVSLGIITLVKINREYTAPGSSEKPAIANTGNDAACYTFSKTGKNVLLIMLDAAVSGYVPRIFEEKPELAFAFNGFTWYPNCVSFSNHTLIGAPPIYGGYEYIPEEINRRDSVPLVEKHKEAYLLLPHVFSEAGFLATITDPPFDNFRMSNLDIFTDYPPPPPLPPIHAENVIGKYSSQWMDTHPDIQDQTINVTDLLHNNLIRFSFFKITPLLFRSFIYDDGHWLTTVSFSNSDNPKDGLTKTFIDNYAFMDLLPQLTTTVNTGNTYTAIYASLPHEPTLLQAPDYIPSANVIIGESKYFSNDNRYHVNIASFLLLEKFFRFLKAEGVYDNTRIILVSDHGFTYTDYETNITLPDGSDLQSYHPLLMVKDFYPESSHENNELTGELRIDNSFMTNADTVFFALKEIVDNPVNPFTYQPLRTYKTDGANIVTINALSSYRHTKYKYNIGKHQWLHVRENIFDPANWEKIEK
jgi:YidC/Oxa1 family membrane protein insertase